MELTFCCFFLSHTFVKIDISNFLHIAIFSPYLFIRSNRLNIIWSFLGRCNFRNFIYTFPKARYWYMRVSVIVPVFNEEETVAQVLESLSHLALDLEVVVVDDASTDRTWEILQELRQKEPFNTYRFVRNSNNQGKGAGLRTGFGLVSGDLVTVQDADMEYPPPPPTPPPPPPPHPAPPHPLASP